MTNRSAKIIFAITAHGLGHLTRTLAVVREFLILYPKTEIVISTATDKKRVALYLPFPFHYRAQDYEPGVVQKNCFEVDIQQTRNAYRDFFKTRKQRLADEEEFIKRHECQGLVSDIPALPVKAAANAGIPAIGLANFTWDWILSPIFCESALEYIPEQIAHDYANGQLHLQLPFGPDASPFSNSENAPLVSRKAKISRFEVRHRLGIPQNDAHKLVAVCPGGWDPDNWDSIHVRGCKSFRFIMVGNLPITADTALLHLAHDLPLGITFPDLVNAADIVLAKPGYGIVSECVMHKTPFVAIERPQFRETPLMLKSLQTVGPYTEIGLADFYSGNWERALVKVMKNNTPWKSFPHNGAQLIAERLGGLFDLA